MTNLLDGIDSLDDFNKLRWSEFHNVETFDEFRQELSKGSISLDNSLGALLEIANFRPGTIGETAWEFDEGYDDHEKWMGYTKRFGVKDSGDASLFQSGRHFGAKELTEFVGEWHTHQTRHIWNPPYAQIKRLPKLYRLCKANTPERIIDICGVSGSQSIHFPFDGWTLAKCMQLSYER